MSSPGLGEAGAFEPASGTVDEEPRGGADLDVPGGQTVVFERREGVEVRGAAFLALIWLTSARDEVPLDWAPTFLADSLLGLWALFFLVALAGLGYESYRTFIHDPSEIQIDGDYLTIRFSNGRVTVIELAEVREVSVEPAISAITAPELVLALADGRFRSFDWRPEVREALFAALHRALMLQPVPGDATGKLLRPLLHPGRPIEAEPVAAERGGGAASDRTCPRCRRRYGPVETFAVDGPSRELVCSDCAEELALERAQEHMAGRAR